MTVARLSKADWNLLCQKAKRGGVALEKSKKEKPSLNMTAEEWQVKAKRSRRLKVRFPK